MLVHPGDLLSMCMFVAHMSVELGVVVTVSHRPRGKFNVKMLMRCGMREFVYERGSHSMFGVGNEAIRHVKAKVVVKALST